MNSEAGKYIIIIGAAIIIIGVIIYFFHDHLHWIGRLPGDVRVKKEHFRFYFPVTTMILFSLILSLVLRLLRKIL